MSAPNEIAIKLALKNLSEVQAGLTALNNHLTSLTRTAIGVGAAALGFAGLEKGIRDIISFGSELARLGSRTDTAVSRLVMLRSAFKDGIGDADGMGQSLNRLQKAIGEAANAGGEGARIFQDELGLSLVHLQQLDAVGQFRAVGESLANMTDHSRRAELAMRFFGRSGGELIPVLKALGEEKGPTAFALVMERTAPVLHEIDLLLNGLGLKARSFFAGVADQLAEPVAAFLRSFKDLDLTPYGQKVGAFVAVAIDEWNAGRFDQFIGLTIEAGFDLGKQAFVGFLHFIGEQFSLGGTLGRIVANGGLTIAAELARALVAGLEFGAQKILDVFEGIALGVIGLFEDAINLFLSGIAKAVNLLPEKLRVMMGLGAGSFLFDPVTLGRDLGAVDEVRRMLTTGFTAWKDSIDGGTHALREMLGVVDQLGIVAGPALEKLKTLIAFKEMERDVQSLIGLIGKMWDAFERPTNHPKNPFDLARFKENLQATLGQNATFGSAETGNWRLSESEKFQARRNELLKNERDIRAGIAELEAARPNVSLQQQEEIDAELLRLQHEQDRNNVALNNQGPNPDSFADQWRATMRSLGDEFGSWAKQTAQSFASVFNSAVGSISEGITGLIMGTKTWGQALAQIGNTILTSVIQAIVQMGVRWVMTQLMMALLGETISTGMLAFNAGIASAYAAVWAEPAALAVMGSYGGAAAAAPEQIAASLATVQGMALVRAAGGGLIRGPGTGTSDSIPARLSDGEYVIPADVVRALGSGYFDALRAGDFSGIAASAPKFSNSVNVGAAPVHVVVVTPDDYEAMLRSGKLDDAYVERLRANAHRVGLRT